MKSINKILMKEKLKNYKKYIKERASSWSEQPSPKCMANASFYRLKFGTIDLMTNCWVGG